MSRALLDPGAGGRRKRGNRAGWSTGACAAAAAAAAARALETGEVPRTIEILLPEDRRASFEILDGTRSESSAQASVIKDAGDDPDVTHGARIVATVVALPEAAGEVRVLGSEGVGRVTRAGLGLTVGEAAINPGPRSYITANVRAAAPSRLRTEGLEVTISVPAGERLAKRTLNARLGILGGISILGTTGVVYPYSTASFKATIRQGVQVARAQGRDTVVFTTGRRTERHCMARYPELPEICFVQMGDFVGAALDAAREAGLKRVVFGAMVGKLTKIAQGLKVTHARKAEVDMQLLARLVADAGGSPALCADVLKGDTARWTAELVAEAGLTTAFHQALTRAAARAVADGLDAGTIIEVLAWGPDGELLAEHAPGRPPGPQNRD
jgi:cobalt-precorrin-5B (C1)-methyltransferase